MRRKGLLIICLVFVLVMMAACSSKAGTESIATNTAAAANRSSAPTNTPAADPMAKKFDISYMGVTYGAIAPNDGPGIKMIDDKFNVNYSANLIPNADYEAKLSALIAANSAPDVFRLGNMNAATIKYATDGA